MSIHLTRPALVAKMLKTEEGESGLNHIPLKENKSLNRNTMLVGEEGLKIAILWGAVFLTGFVLYLASLFLQ